MNYNEYMELVNKKLLAMSESEKTRWIYNALRVAKENERIKSLNSLDVEQDYNSFVYEKDKLEEWCSKVEESEIYFECEGHEEYEEGYWDSDYVYEYYDPFGIIKDINKAFKIAEDLLYQKEYKESQALSNRILGMSFNVSDVGTGDWYEMNFKEITDEVINSFDYERVILNLLYATYNVTDGRNRAEVLYKYLNWDESKNIKIEEIFRIGSEELRDIDCFMDDWISFLSEEEGDRAGKLLLEACLYKGGIKYLCETSRTKYLKHPVLFKYACEYFLREGNDLECEKLGLEAIGVLHEYLVIRGEIAELTAKAAENLLHKDVVNKCCEAAFYSKPSLNNYLRLFDIPDYKNITSRASKYAQKLPESISKFDHGNNQMMFCILSRSHKDVIRFFNGEFDYIHDKCRKDDLLLGWSDGFKGVAVPFFILLLNKNNEITKAVSQLIDGIVHRIGLIEMEKEEFFNLFLKWREKQNITDEQYKKYIMWLEEEADKRVEAVVGGGYRKSYYKAAILVVSLGETLESNGCINGKMLTIEKYRKLHSKKRAFKSELELLS